MLTCFIRTEFSQISQRVTIYIFLIIPCAFFFYSIFLCLKMFCNRKIIRDSGLSKFFYKYMSVIIIYFILKFPLILLYWLSASQPRIYKHTFLSWLSFVRFFLYNKLIGMRSYFFFNSSYHNFAKIDTRICEY